MGLLRLMVVSFYLKIATAKTVIVSHQSWSAITINACAVVMGSVMVVSLVAYALPYVQQSHMASVIFGQCRIITLTIQRQ
jgi:hypothetical protein